MMKIPYDERDIVHIGGVDHPESIAVGPAADRPPAGDPPGRQSGRR